MNYHINKYSNSRLFTPCSPRFCSLNFMLLVFGYYRICYFFIIIILYVIIYECYSCCHNYSIALFLITAKTVTLTPTVSKYG
jgi:hypothetical protein